MGVCAAEHSSSSATDLARTRDFVHRIERGSATEVVPVTGGFAVLNREFPSSWEHNCLVLERFVDPSQVIREADRVLGGAGLGHRAIEVELEGLDPTWFDHFRRRGYLVHPWVTMVLRGVPDRHPRVPVERVTLDEVKAVMETGWRRELPGASDDTVRQLVDRRVVTYRACEVTHHVVRGADGIAARCDLYRIAPVAQVESVETEPHWRNRGFATAVVLDAVGLARTSGCELVFLIADAEDWPQEFYGRLGFERVGGGYTMELPPEGAPARVSNPNATAR